MAEKWPTAGDLMTPRPITIAPEAPVSQALGVMRSKSIHELPVLRARHLLGMVTFESIARRSNLPLNTKVEHLMILPPLVTPETPYTEVAEQLLAAGLRAAPVVGKRGELVGVVSRTDLVRALPDLPTLARHRVETVASPAGVLIREDEPVGSLLPQVRLLEEHPLPVVNRKGRLVGAVGVADLGRVYWRPTTDGKKQLRDKPERVDDIEVGSIMHSPAVTVSAGTSTGDAAQSMTRNKVSSVFVVEDDRPTGVVSQSDLLGLAVGRAETPRGPKFGDVYVQIHGLRGSSDPSVYADLDRVVAKGLRRISRHVRPILLSLHITPQGNHRSTDATVQARVYTNQGIYYASQSGWNFFAAVADALEELGEQARRAREEGRGRRRRTAGPSTHDEEPADPELEAKIREATGDD